jgi:sulfate adenylyltransferase subunit 2
MDVWQYIEREKLELPSIYFAHTRDIVKRSGAIVPITEVTPPMPGEKIENLTVRFRTVGDITCTAPVLSEADTVEKIIMETASTVITSEEKQGWMIKYPMHLWNKERKKATFNERYE